MKTLKPKKFSLYELFKNSVQELSDYFEILTSEVMIVSPI